MNGNDETMTKTALESLISEVQCSLDMEGLLPMRRTYLEGGMYYLHQLQSLIGAAVVPGKELKLKRAKAKASVVNGACSNADSASSDDTQSDMTADSNS